jgi:hypothetical protein
MSDAKESSSCPVCRAAPAGKINWLGRKDLLLLCHLCKRRALLSDGSPLFDDQGRSVVPEGPESDARYNPVLVDGHKCWASFRQGIAVVLDDGTGARNWDEWSGVS